DLRDKLVLLHCHIGSQIADIQAVKRATKEVTQIYAALIRRGMKLKYLDVGGGLGVNYDKGHYEEDAGINYSLQEYANAVVFTVKEVCDANEVPMPILVTESGRALTAHHSVLIVPVIGAQSKDDSSVELVVPKDYEDSVQALGRILDYLPAIQSPGELLEAYHDAKERLDEVGTLFTLGYLPLEQRARSGGCLPAADDWLSRAAALGPPRGEARRLVGRRGGGVGGRARTAGRGGRGGGRGADAPDAGAPNGRENPRHHYWRQYNRR